MWVLAVGILIAVSLAVAKGAVRDWKEVRREIGSAISASRLRRRVLTLGPFGPMGLPSCFPFATAEASPAFVRSAKARLSDKLSKFR